MEEKKCEVVADSQCTVLSVLLQRSRLRATCASKIALDVLEGIGSDWRPRYVTCGMKEYERI